MAGFSKTVMSAKKQDPSVFEKAQMGEVALLEGGTRLAARALAIGSVLAIVGVGGLCFTFWKLTGAKNVSGLRFPSAASVNHHLYCRWKSSRKR